MSATPQQIKQLQAICAGKFSSREERLEAVSEIISSELSSFNELTVSQAYDVISFFNTGKIPDNASWGRFDKHNSRHRSILSRCYTLGWRDDETGYADLNRLGGWLKSSRSPVKKPLMEMNAKEQSKIIAALDGMIKKKYKN